ncbi:MAG: hypothetical protein JRG91_12595 [Deltaproteobacteria bacterium]|nr:hypothetical protein [Deltaproteobacteria bacterium]
MTRGACIPVFIMVFALGCGGGGGDEDATADAEPDGVVDVAEETTADAADDPAPDVTEDPDVVEDPVEDPVEDTTTDSPGFTCGDVLTDSRDGWTYQTVLIGTQCWMQENLNIGTLTRSTAAGSQMSDDGTIERYCWENDVAWCNGADGLMRRGGFYEWREAMDTYTGWPTAPVQGICPAGWHIPSQAEFNAMVTHLGGTSAAVSRLQVGGDSGFEALLTGYRCTMSGTFRPSAMSSAFMAYFWVSDHSDSENSPLWEIGASDMSTFAFYHSLGLSVRCILD